MLHISLRRGPSQKLSKPVPNNGLPVIPVTNFQISVRPVRVESLPIVSTRLDPVSKKSAKQDILTNANTRRCTSQGFRRTVVRLVAIIKAVAMRKQDNAVTVLAVHISESAMRS